MEQWASLLPDGTRDESAASPSARRARHGQGQGRRTKDGQAVTSPSSALARYHGPPRLERIPSSRSWDPFNALIVLQMSKAERFMLNYAYTRSWATWGDDFVQAWMRNSMESSAVFYAQIFGAASHYQLQRRGALDSSDPLVTVRQRSKARALENLRGEIDMRLKKPSAPVSDSLLMAMFTLGVHDDIDVSSPVDESGEEGEGDEDEAIPMTQLAKLRDMQVYAWVNFASEHMEMIFRLIEQHGLDKFNTKIFGIVMPLLDMIYGARNHAPPRIPCSWTLRPVRRVGVWSPDDEAIEMLTKAGSYFRQPAGKRSSPYAIDRSVCGMISVLAEGTVVLEHVHRAGLKVVTDYSVWFDNCNWACHKLFCKTYPRPDSPSAEETDVVARVNGHLTEICALAGLLYVDMVIFPTLSKQAEIKTSLASEMLDILEMIQLEVSVGGGEWESVKNVVGWAAMMGGISSSARSPLRERCVNFIADHCITHGSEESWEDVRAQLISLLWIQSAFDRRGQKVWEQAKERNRLADVS